MLRKKLIDTLTDLKQTYGAKAIKAEFEDEGASFEEILHLKNLAIDSDLELTIKIGGSGALNDVNQVKMLGADTIVAPMIESSYALQKFVQMINSVYSQEFTPNLFINIETIFGVENFDNILESPFLNNIDGIVIGRFDLAKSLGLVCKDCNGNKIFNLVNELAIKTKSQKKIFAVGGGINHTSIDFFKKLCTNINQFETRKIVFQYSLNKNFTEGIYKAIQFEKEWITYRQALGIIHTKDSSRLQILQKRSQNMLNFT